MNKKSIITLIIILVIFVGIPCLINFSNFCLGSNRMFYRTVLDYPNTKWICDEPSAIIEITNKQFDDTYGAYGIMEVEANGDKERFNILTLIDHFDLFLLDENGERVRHEVNDNYRIHTRAKYRKNILGDVTSFTIQVVNEEQSIAGYKKLKFRKYS